MKLLPSPFVFMKVLLDCNPAVLRIERIEGEDGKPDLRIHLDRAGIQSIAKPAIGKFLKMLQASICYLIEYLILVLEFEFSPN